MLYEREAKGSVQEVADRLAKAVPENRFGVIQVIDLRAKMVEKGVPFANACIIFEVCNPKQAKAVLERNMAISTALPCRISVYEQDGKVKVATVRPTVVLGLYGDSEELRPVAREVEDAILRIIDAACG